MPKPEAYDTPVSSKRAPRYKAWQPQDRTESPRALVVDKDATAAQAPEPPWLPMQPYHRQMTHANHEPRG